MFAVKRCLLLLCVVTIFRDSGALLKGSTDYEDMSFWLKSGQETLHKILAHQNNVNRAKNVIIFIGDGMGLSTITSGRVYVGQLNGYAGEEYQLVFEKFPNTGLAKTYNVDKQVPDSAGTATAIFSGVKCRYKVIGLDAKAEAFKCDKKINEGSTLTTVADWAQQSGKDTGFVTTTRVTHATPAGLYAHTNNRDWECDSKIPKDQQDCAKDIGRQLVEDKPGNQFKVIMGGGAQCLGAEAAKAVDVELCSRADGRNLVKEWQVDHPEGRVVTNMQDLMSIDIGNTSHIFGVFSPDHLPYHAMKTAETPSLMNMTTQAIRLLKKNENGFLLMVESGKIDLAHHKNRAQLALGELHALNEAVKAALRLVNLEETLIIVTADHSHSFTLNGYPTRGNDILGFAHKSNETPYETLTYANGPGFFYHRRNDSQNVNETWRNVEEDPNHNQPTYRHFAAIYLKDETHAGEDVGVYAIGPYAHLFRGTFEQNYIAHAVAYAACFKDWPSHCDKSYHRYFYSINAPRNYKVNSAVQTTTSFATFIVFILTMMFIRL